MKILKSFNIDLTKHILKEHNFQTFGMTIIFMVDIFLKQENKISDLIIKTFFARPSLTLKYAINFDRSVAESRCGIGM